MMSERPYAKRLMLLVLLSSVVLTLTDFLFKSIVARQVAAVDMPGFFSSTYLGLNLVIVIYLLFTLFLGRQPNPRIFTPLVLISIPAAVASPRPVTIQISWKLSDQWMAQIPPRQV